MATSVIGGLVTWVNSGSPSAAIRTALGSGTRFFADQAPEGQATPYSVCFQVSESVENIAAGYAFEVVNTLVQVDVWADGRAKVESVLDAFENALIFNQSKLTLTTKTHLQTTKGNKVNEKDPDQPLWHGILELNFLVQKDKPAP